jgi:Ca2+-binding RTX toxin-like protein
LCVTISSWGSAATTSRTTASATTLYGNDTVRIDSPNIGNDKVSGGEGNDHLLYGNAASTTRQTLGGGSGEDVIIGGRGGDNLHGGRDDDRIEGRAGRDTIEGGLGADLLEGGEGGDIFRYSGFDSDPAPGLFDRILDFKTGWDSFEMPQPGTEQNYVEEGRNTDNFIAALDRANQLFLDSDGAKSTCSSPESPVGGSLPISTEHWQGWEGETELRQIMEFGPPA